MSVIVSRALPDVRDGLKPVHRRVLYSMHDSGLQPNRQRVKCASVVGEVMKSFHPHGDSAIYDTLVRLAQSFAMRYPLVDGQGNFGNIDGYPAAAMRYTECRLTRIATELLRDIDADTVDFGPNYDERRTEPQVLPARYPEPARQRLVRDRRRHGDEHPAASSRRDDRRARRDDRRPADRRRPADAIHQGAGLPDVRDHPRPGRHPRGIPLGPRPHRHARPRAHRGAARRPHRGRRDRAALRGEEGRRRRRDLEGRRARQGRRAHRGRRPQGSLRQVGHAARDPPQARRRAAGRAEQALQAHRAADDVRLQRGGARGRRAAHARPARSPLALPRAPARSRHAPPQVRAAQGASPARTSSRAT